MSAVKKKTVTAQIPGYKWLRWKPNGHGSGWRWRLISESAVSDEDIREWVQEQGYDNASWDFLDAAPTPIVKHEFAHTEARRQYLREELIRLSAVADRLDRAKADPCPNCNDAPRYERAIDSARGATHSPHRGTHCPYCGNWVDLAAIKFLIASDDGDAIVLLGRLAGSGGASGRVRDGARFRYPVPKEDEPALSRLQNLGLVIGSTYRNKTRRYLSLAGEQEAKRHGFTVAPVAMKDDDE